MTTYSGKDFWQKNPTKWPTVPLRKVARLGTGHTPSRSVEEYWQNCTIPWVTTEDLTARRGAGLLRPLMKTRQHISELGLANSAAELHPAGTVMLSRTASVGHVARVGKPMATTQAFVTWTCSEALEPRYLAAVLLAMNPEFFRLAYGSTHLTIYMPDIEQLRVPLPPLAEQRAIADYLDAETARIDALIAKKQQLIHLLEERLRAEMTELACGRLRGAPLADSGIDWIGKIPASWQVVRLNKVARLESGHTPARTREELWVGADKPWITLNDVGTLAESEFIRDTRNLISDAGLAASSARMLPANTVVLSRDATIGRVGIMATDMATSQHFAAWVCSSALRPRFLWLLLRYAMQPFLTSFDDGATLRTIGMPHVRRFVVPLPPLEEQDELVAQAETRRAAITAGGRSLGRQIELLAEHRQAIISAAVTGELSSAATG